MLGVAKEYRVLFRRLCTLDALQLIDSFSAIILRDPLCVKSQFDHPEWLTMMVSSP